MMMDFLFNMPHSSFSSVSICPSGSPVSLTCSRYFDSQSLADWVPPSRSHDGTYTPRSAHRELPGLPRIPTGYESRTDPVAAHWSVVFVFSASISVHCGHPIKFSSACCMGAESSIRITRISACRRQIEQLADV